MDQKKFKVKKLEKLHMQYLATRPDQLCNLMSMPPEKCLFMPDHLTQGSVSHFYLSLLNYLSKDAIGKFKLISHYHR